MSFTVLFTEGTDDAIIDLIKTTPTFTSSGYTHGPHGALIIHSDDGRELHLAPGTWTAVIDQ